MLLSEGAVSFDCSKCSDRERDNRNCRNRKQFKKTCYIGSKEWRSVTSHHGKPVFKNRDLKLYECPESFCKRRSWNLIRMVNETSDEQGIRHFPFPGGYQDQPEWYLEAYRIVSRERSEHSREKLKNQ